MGLHAFETIQDVGLVEVKRRLSSYLTAGESITPGKEVHPIEYKHELLWFQDGVHVDLTFHPFKALARKCITHVTSSAFVNGWQPSDSKATGDLKLVLAVPNHISVGMLEEFTSGLAECAEEMQVSLSSVDVTAARTALGIACSFQYSVNEASWKHHQQGKPKPGESLCVTGDVGAAFAGLRILLREKRIWLQQQELHKDPNLAFEPELEAYSDAVKRQLAPDPRGEFFKAITQSGITPTSITLLLDGLYNDIQKVLTEASLGAEIFESALPISLVTREIANELEEDVDRYAFLGGEDYEILFTLPSEQVDLLQEHFKDFVVIGEIKPEKEQLIIHTSERGAEKHPLI